MEITRKHTSDNQRNKTNPVTNFENSLDDSLDDAMRFYDISEDLNNSVNLVKINLVPEENTGESAAKRRKCIANFDTQSSNKLSYYGLPSKVENLVKKYKGISKLYGEFF